MSCINNTDSVLLDVTGGVLTADLNVDPDPSNALSVSASGVFVSGPNETGWFDAGETWTYASVDGPTFTFTVIGDKTGKYKPGMRIKVTQTTDRFFIVTAVSYDGGSGLTTVTIYGGANYSLTNAAINNPQYSVAKVPLGFSVDPINWTESVSDTTNRSQASPTQNNWYNLGSLSLTVPIGAWLLGFEMTMFGSKAGFTSDAWAALSVTNNGATDQELVALCRAYDSVENTLKRQKPIDIAAKTVYYLNEKTSATGMTSLALQGADATTKARAICAYL